MPFAITDGQLVAGNPFFGVLSAVVFWLEMVAASVGVEVATVDGAGVSWKLFEGRRPCLVFALAAVGGAYMLTNWIFCLSLVVIEVVATSSR